MNGHQAKKLRREARAMAAQIAARRFAEQTVLRRRWWLSAFFLALPVLARLGVRMSESTLLRIMRRGSWIEVVGA